jgi:hypothetical protein
MNVPEPGPNDSGSSSNATIERIVELLDAEDSGTANTSMRIPHTLREAAALAVAELGAAESTTMLTSNALRASLEAIVVHKTLATHYEQHPDARPTLAALAIAAAELDNHPLASEPALLSRAAAQILETHPEADADDVLLWAEAQALATA